MAATILVPGTKVVQFQQSPADMEVLFQQMLLWIVWECGAKQCIWSFRLEDLLLACSSSVFSSIIIIIIITSRIIKIAILFYVIYSEHTACSC